MFFLSTWLIPSLLYIGSYYYPERERSIWDTFWYIINRVDILLFIATITIGALFTTGFGKKELMYKITTYSFIISMGLLFLIFLRWLFSLP